VLLLHKNLTKTPASLVD